MDKRLAEKIIQNFDFKTMEVFKEYLEDQIKQSHMMIESTSDDVDFYRGRINAFRHLMNIRDYAVRVTENKG